MIPASHQLSLRLMEKCPACRSVVPVKNIHILDETEMNMLAHLACSQCYNKYLTYIVHHPNGLVGNAVLTDLTYDETLLFLSEKRMDEDTFLNLYQLVRRDDFITNLAKNINL